MIKTHTGGRFHGLLAAVAILGISALTATSAGAQTFDIVSGFSSAANNGTFIAGSRSTVTGTAFTLDTVPISFNGGAVSGFALTPVTLPFVVKNNTGSTQVYATTVTHAPDVLNLHPFQGAEEYSVLRFTVGAVGAGTLADISGFYRGLDATTTAVYVVVDGSTLFSQGVGGFGDVDAFNLTNVSVATGSVIDFVVGNGGNGFGQDSTGLAGTVTIRSTEASAAPEPSAGLLALVGAPVGIALYRRRRRSA
jgi:hypothetical protein